jgi:CBS domain containing-hemolysin-like protein
MLSVGGGGGTGTPLTAAALLWATAFIVLLTLIAAFFSGVEIGIMTLNRLKVESAARRGNRLAKMQLALRDKPENFLSTILICYNLSHIALTVYATKLALNYAATLGLSEQQTLLASSALVTLIIVMFAELIPKTYAAVNTEKIANFATLPLFYIDKLLRPINWVINLLVAPFIRLLTGKRGAAHGAPIPERGELLTAVTLALSGGEIHEIDAKVAQEALHFSTIDLRDVMTPRVDVTGIEEQQNLGEALRLMRQTGYSRLPVYRETIDEVIGVVLIKDMIGVLAAEAEDGIAREWFKDKVAGYIREVAYFPESKSVVDALAEIRTMRSHLAVVVDEHGGTAGIVTLEDILEELIGDIRDENDPDHSIDIVSSGEGWLIVTGRARVDSVPALHQLAEEGRVDATSIGGLLMETLGRPAVVGDVVELAGGVKVSALKVLRNRIKLVRVEFPVTAEEETEASAH